jgi:hypothetical protein
MAHIIRRIILVAFICVSSVGLLQAQKADTICPDSILTRVHALLLEISSGERTARQELILSMVTHPILIECYADNSKGDTLDKRDMAGQFSKIFDESFFNEVHLLASDKDRLRSSMQLINSSWVLSINVNYPDEYNERSRLFKIGVLQTGFKWLLIQCTG